LSNVKAVWIDTKIIIYRFRREDSHLKERKWVGGRWIAF